MQYEKKTENTLKYDIDFKFMVLKNYNVIDKVRYDLIRVRRRYNK